MSTRPFLMTWLAACLFAGIGHRAAGQWVYWTQRAGGNDGAFPRIMRARFDGSEREAILSSHEARAIVLDPITRKVYWSDDGGLFIRRANFDGSEPEIIVRLGDSLVDSMAIDAGGGKLYWTQNRSSPYSARFQGTVRRANLDGTNPEVLFEYSDDTPVTSIALDVLRGHVYWGDRYGRILWRANLDGSEAQEWWQVPGRLVHSVVLEPEPWTLYASVDVLYGWSAVLRTRPGSSAWETVLEGYEAATRSLHLHHRDGRLYWAGGRKVLRMNRDGTGLETYADINALGFALDDENGNVYWSTREPEFYQSGNSLLRGRPDGTSLEVIFANPLRRARGIALEASGKKIYWADAELPAIMRADRDGAHVEFLVTDGLTAPKDVVLDPLHGKMYWTDAGSMKIQRANLDGRAVEDIVTEGVGDPGGFAIDVHAGKIYWGDLRELRLRRADLDGTHAEVLAVGSPLAIAIDALHNRLLWAESAGVVLLELSPLRRRFLIVSPNPEFIILDEVTQSLYWLAGGSVFQGGLHAFFASNPSDPFTLTGQLLFNGIQRAEGMAAEFPPFVPPASIAESDPPHCATDARVHHRLGNPALRYESWDSIDIRMADLNGPVAAAEFNLFTVSVDPVPQPGIADVAPLSNDRFRVQLDRSIPLGAWTCVRYEPSQTLACLGYVPGDVNGDARVRSTDVAAIVNCLTGAIACPLWKCDVDRSGQCNARDILTVIDLLNHVPAYEPVNAALLPACP